MSQATDPTQALRDLQPQQQFFVGIDSDGCAFDTMEIKHKECFCPMTIKYWGLQPVSKYAREAFEFVNLYSKWRGANRWPALVKVLDLLRERAEVVARGVEIPPAPKLREFIASGQPMSNAGLKVYMAEHPDAELQRGMDWSVAVNDAIEDIVHGVPPFPFVRESLQALNAKADVVVVSATPTDALEREWSEHDIARYVRIIAGQEMGTKKQHLAAAAQGKYAEGHILMIGDAMGDLEAARSINALFFPILPGEEEKSWERFYNEAMHKFLACEYAGAYEEGLIAEFKQYLPETPKWQVVAKV
jgi:phosphoglycolate phosphatase-like HAD superfamily hydrolase